MEFTEELSHQRKSDQDRAAILANPGFGDFFTDHTAVIDWTASEDGVTGTWDKARIEPYGPISLDPAASVLHYGQEIFEGLKAYRHADGSVWTFRPYANAARLTVRPNALRSRSLMKKPLSSPCGGWSSPTSTGFPTVMGKPFTCARS